ncbi:FAD-dependent oxidoreductase [Candidatus Falkowbacteria bacterium]|nr:FAD-dependent oxidoreductase [Candidatus Falkowbacteria bacterium]
MIYDILIIGAGPAGYTASIYASRYGLKNIIIGATLGGYAAESHKICNYPSEIEISGKDLMRKFYDHAALYGAPIINEEVVAIKKDVENFIATTMSGTEYSGRNLILAIGTKPKKLNVVGEEKLLGRGISYCFTCDGFFFKDKVVAVAGSGNSAHSASIYLSRIAKKVYQIVRGAELKGEIELIEEIKNNPKVGLIFNTNILEVIGGQKLEKIKLDKEFDGSLELVVDGLFVEIGTKPELGVFRDLKLRKNREGFIKVNADQSTNVVGVWATGDITTGSNGLRQIVTACSEGAIAAGSISRHLKSQN